MTKEELKKKIINLLDEATGSWYEDEDGMFAEGYSAEEGDNRFKAHVADALIAAGLKFDVNYSFTAAFNSVQAERERDLERRLTVAEHRAEVAERALRNAAPRLNCHGGLGKGFCRVDKCDYYHCDNDEGCVKAHLQQAEKELAEEKKDD